MDDFDAMIASLRRLGTLAEDAAVRAAPLLEEAFRATAAAGTAPDGTPWKPRKKDGARPLVNAAKAIHVQAYGTLVRAILSGPTVFHHFGNANDPRRPVLPDPGVIPPMVARVLERAGDQAFAAAVA